MEGDAAGFGVYVHWPFCAAKCPYCDFNSHVRHDPPNQSSYSAAMATEIAHMAALQPGEEVTSVFFGGGTPSLMEPGTVAEILEAIAGSWPVAESVEITLEANPTSVEADRFRGYRQAGVNRVSLGVQSLSNEQLKFLGRQHSAEEAIAAIELARNIFPRLSFDLIYARPGQQLADWKAELERAIELAADHLSLYQLTIEPGTPFHDLAARGKIVVPDEDRAAELYELTQETTGQHGLPAYEISNHARPGCESRHNLTYWRFGNWAGVGPGAHGRLTVNHTRHATSTQRHPETWLEQVRLRGHGLVEDEPLHRDAAADEMLLMGLRLREGLDISRYVQKTGRQLDESRLEHLIELGLMEKISSDRLRATAAGWLVLNSVIAELAA